MDYIEQVTAAKVGDTSAFVHLVEERKNYLFRIAYMYVKNEQDALDILSDAIYKAYISLNRLKEPKAFHTWITMILINCAKNHKKKYKDILSFDDEIAVNNIVYEKNNEEYLDLYQAVDRLRGNFKTVIILKYFEYLTIGEISRIMDCPEGTIKSYLHRAIKKLRVELEVE